MNLPLDGDIVVLGQVFDELLGDGGAALDILTSEHVEDGRSGAFPVHTVVLPEPPVLNGHGGVDQSSGMSS